MGQPELNSLRLADERATLAAGQRLVGAVLEHLPDNRAFVIHLTGPLGAGKTTFARGMLRGAGIEGQIRSPTYTLVELYETAAAIRFVHIDLYRIEGASDADGLGLREYDEPGTVWLIEWPERVAVAPQVDICVALSHHGEGRELRLSGSTRCGTEAVEAAG